MVITNIILLILAGVTLNLMAGGRGAIATGESTLAQFSASYNGKYGT